MPGSLISIQYGSGAGATSQMSFVLARAVAVGMKPITGEVRRQTGKLIRSDMLDAPLSISTLTGINVSRAVDTIPDADSRAWEMLNIDAWPGMFCLAPKGQTTTDISGTRQVTGFAEGIGKVFYFAENTGADVENVAYFVGSTTTWTSATLTADWKATTTNASFPCRGMCETGSGGAEQRIYALRSDYVTVAAANYQLAYSANGTTWTIINHVNAVDTPGGAVESYFIVNLADVLYCLSWNTSTVVTLRQSTNDGVTWTSATGGGLVSAAAPRGLVVYWDNAYPRVQRVFVLLQEGIWMYTGSTMVQVVDFRSVLDTNNGKFPIVAGGYLVVPQGRTVWYFYWDSNGQFQGINGDFFQKNSQGLPLFRQGRVLCQAVSREFAWAGVGGEDSTHTGGIYKRNAQGQWFGPLYDIATANRQPRAMFFSGQDDYVGRVHIAMDNGTASDTDQIFLEAVDVDPRSQSSPKHAATGILILPKHDRGLAELWGVWRKYEVMGTNLSATNKIAALYTSKDAAPLASNGSWGTTWGSITATAGSIAFSVSGEPANTGIYSRALQVRIDLSGTSDASPYIETQNIYVKKSVALKMIHAYVIEIEAQGSQRPRQVVLADLKAVFNVTDLLVTAGEDAATVMEPYTEGGQSALSFTDDPEQLGSGQAHAGMKFAVLTLADV